VAVEAMASTLEAARTAIIHPHWLVLQTEVSARILFNFLIMSQGGKKSINCFQLTKLCAYLQKSKTMKEEKGGLNQTSLYPFITIVRVKGFIFMHRLDFLTKYSI
jgi:hypothetical protein